MPRRAERRWESDWIDPPQTGVSCQTFVGQLLGCPMIPVPSVIDLTNGGKRVILYVFAAIGLIPIPVLTMEEPSCAAPLVDMVFMRV